MKIDNYIWEVIFECVSDFLKFMMGGGFLIFYLYKFFVMNDNCCFFMILYDFNLLVYLSKKVLFIV